MERCLDGIQEERETAKRIREEALLAEQREKERIAKEKEAKKQAAQAQKDAAEKKKKEEEEAAAEQARKLVEAAAGQAAAAAASQGSDRVSPSALEEWKTYQAILDHIKKTVNPTFKGLAPDVRKWCMNRKRDIIAILGRIVHQQKEVFLVVRLSSISTGNPTFNFICDTYAKLIPPSFLSSAFLGLGNRFDFCRGEEESWRHSVLLDS